MLNIFLLFKLFILRFYCNIEIALLGWLEPLLARIAEDHTRVIAPVIDMISDHTMGCWGNEIGAVGTFDLTIMGFKWLNLEKKQKENHHPTRPWQ